METFVHWLRITEFILNNAHCTQNDRLASPLQSNVSSYSKDPT